MEWEILKSVLKRYQNKRKDLMNMFNKICLGLVIIGAINWLLIGLFGFDFVGALFGGQMALLSRIVFIIVGLAGLWCITLLFSNSPRKE